MKRRLILPDHALDRSERRFESDPDRRSRGVVLQMDPNAPSFFQDTLQTGLGLDEKSIEDADAAKGLISTTSPLRGA